MTYEEWIKIDRKVVDSIHLYLVDPVLFNVAEEKIMEYLWENLGKLYETKSTKNNNFMKNNIYHMRMKEGSYVVDHLNEFNTLTKKIISTGCGG